MKSNKNKNKNNKAQLIKVEVNQTEDTTDDSQQEDTYLLHCIVCNNPFVSLNARQGICPACDPPSDLYDDSTEDIKHHLSDFNGSGRTLAVFSDGGDNPSCNWGLWWGL